MLFDCLLLGVYKAKDKMKLIEDDFSKELTSLLNKHKKTIESDKSGIYIVERFDNVKILLGKPTTGSEDWRTKIYFAYG